MNFLDIQYLIFALASMLYFEILLRGFKGFFMICYFDILAWLSDDEVSIKSGISVQGPQVASFITYYYKNNDTLSW